MLKIALTNEPDGTPVCAPQVFCDHCGERIEDARDGNYEWFPDLDGEPDQLCDAFFTHKRCSRLFEAETGRRSWCNELEYLPVFLGNGLDLGWDRAHERASRQLI